ncbi:CD15/CS22/SEF14 family fimbrial major subunit [Salmonella enterica]|nr:CD15/CS22/SEF14 family fimbrial major subunit [Salmonella enterica subsp. enterica serovar Paratyphi A]
MAGKGGFGYPGGVATGPRFVDGQGQPVFRGRIQRANINSAIYCR